jgi:hypothetical protein
MGLGGEKVEKGLADFFRRHVFAGRVGERNNSAETFEDGLAHFASAD